MTPSLTIAALLLVSAAAWQASPASACFPASDTPTRAAAAPVLFTGLLDRTSVLQGGDGLVRLELVMASDATPEVAARVPTDLVVVMDRSGSMSGEKMDHALAATRALVGHLQPEDRFALVTYASDVRAPIPLTAATPSARAGWSAIIDGVRATGSTNLSAALDRAYTLIDDRAAGRAGRVVLLSDGLPTMGDTTPAGLRERALRFAVAEVPLTAAGVGDDFDEFLMTSLADAGTGNYHYLQSGQGLASVFADEFEAANESVASGLEVTLRLAPGVEIVEAAGYPVTRDGDGARIAIGGLYAGQERRIWVTLRAPTDAVGSRSLGEASLAYRRVDGSTVDAMADGAHAEVGLDAALALDCVADETQWVASVDRTAWGRAVVTEEYSALRTTVSRQVKAGDLAAAKAEIDAYRARNFALNASVGSAAVTSNLDELTTLEAQVDAAFEGEAQTQKQAVFSKSHSASGYYSRRGGQVKGR